jgi:SPP1 gp7 family putative phage head morphogenesis protein
MESFDTILDWSIMHQVRLMQLSVGLQEEALYEIDGTEEDIAEVAAALAVFMSTVGGLRADDPRAVAKVGEARQRLFTFRRGGFLAAFGRLEARLGEVKRYELQFHSALLRSGGRNVTVPATALGDPEIMGKTLKDWRQRLFNNDLHRLSEGLTLGARLGDNEAALRARLIGHKSYGGRDGLTATTRREMDALVRTATDVFADFARVNIAIENPLAGKEVYVALLDSRTTEQCKGLHGKVFAASEGPRPPVHWYCRSTRVPLVGNGPNSIPRYREWLNRLSAADQNEVLGSRQARAFREGKLDLQSFREPNWRGIDLETLAQRERRVFEAAGMDVPFQ